MDGHIYGCDHIERNNVRFQYVLIFRMVNDEVDKVDGS